MTLREAGELNIEVWTHLRDNPEIARKWDLPDNFRNRIFRLRCMCPLCEVFLKDCLRCPLFKSDPYLVCFYYERWKQAKTNRGRAWAANRIVKLTQAWLDGLKD